MIQIRAGIFIFLLLIVTNLRIFAFVEAVIPYDNYKGTSDIPCKSVYRYINSLQQCDGVADCRDGSDEDNCDGKAILLYYFEYSRRLPIHCVSNGGPKCVAAITSRPLIIQGDYLGTDRDSFTINLTDEGPGSTNHEWSIRIAPLARQIDVFFEDLPRKRMIRVPRENSTSIVPIEDTIESVAADWVTSSVYYIANLSKIKKCDEDLLSCESLSSEFIRRPVTLAVVHKDRSLFWIEQTSRWDGNYTLYKYALDDGSRKTELIATMRHTTPPQWLTHDSAGDQLYWMNVHEDTAQIYSTTFSPTDSPIIPAISIKKTTSFAVFGNTLYWPDPAEKKIWKCPIANCSRPSPFRDFSYIANSLQADETLTNFTINQLIVDHRPCTLKHDACSYPDASSSALQIERVGTSRILMFLASFVLMKLISTNRRSFLYM